jgi:hypothetical protein
MPQAEIWLLNHSEHVVTLPVPLFPSDREYDSINLQLISGNRAWVELRTSKNPRGGRMAATQKFTLSLCKKSAQGGEVEGGGSLPVVAAADGQGWVVETMSLGPCLQCAVF